MGLSSKLWSIFKLSLIVFLLWSGSPLSAGTPASFYPQTLGKLGPGVLEGLAEGFPRRLIVRFDDSAIRAEATRRRIAQHLPFEDRQIIEWKRDRYRETKNRELSPVLPGNPQVAQDYDYLPMALMEFPNEESLANFLVLEGVASVYENMSVYMTQAPDLSLIQQPQLYAQGYGGAGSVVAILDTGVNYGNSAFGSCAAPGAPCKVVAAVDANLSNPSGTPLDTNGHGTNVAGIVLEVAPDAAVADVKIFDANASATYADVINGINWAIANQSAYNIVALNMSLGDGGDYTTPCSDPNVNAFVAPIESAQSAGILSVAASGNSGYTNGISNPACTPGVVSVGAVYDANLGGVNWGLCTDATTAADKVACFSNSSYFLTLLAPGVDITAAGETYSGTSQATPHVSGAIAVFRAAFPFETLDTTVARLTVSGIPVTDARNNIVTPSLDVLGALVPANDLFANATVLTGSSGSISGTNDDATRESGEPDIAGNPGGRSVWFTWTAPNSGWFSFDTSNCTFDTLLGVYTGTEVNQLSVIASSENNGSPGNTSGLTFYAQAGAIYKIAVDGYNGGFGNYVLNWGASPVAVPALGRWGSGLLCILTVCIAWLSFRPRKDSFGGREESAEGL